MEDEFTITINPIDDALMWHIHSIILADLFLKIQQIQSSTFLKFFTMWTMTTQTSNITLILATLLW